MISIWVCEVYSSLLFKIFLINTIINLITKQSLLAREFYTAITKQKKLSPTGCFPKDQFLTGFLDYEDLKQAKIFHDFPLLALCLQNYSTFFPVNRFFSKFFKNIWTLNFEKTLNFETQKTCVQADYKRSFFLKPKWLHGGFKLSQLETSFIIQKQPKNSCFYGKKNENFFMKPREIREKNYETL